MRSSIDVDDAVPDLRSAHRLVERFVFVYVLFRIDLDVGVHWECRMLLLDNMLYQKGS